MKVTWQTVALVAVLVAGMVCTAVFAPEATELLLSEAVLGVIASAFAKPALER